MPTRWQEWVAYPDAELCLGRFLSKVLAETSAIRNFADKLLSVCAVRLRDIVDHIEFCDEEFISQIEACGWQHSNGNVWKHPHGYFPKLVLTDNRPALVIRVESIEDFLGMIGSDAPISGWPLAPVRRARVPTGGVGLDAVERNGGTELEATAIDSEHLQAARYYLQLFRTRRRYFDCPGDGLAQTARVVSSAVEDIGTHYACALWLRAEREYWMARCSPAAFQKKRQDAAGIGWSNIDHHTYDSSREHFAATIGILESLGYARREVIYAGNLAGWGSQILEQPALDSTIFADVDLAPDELDIDFTRAVLPALTRHRRAGLVCALHGESMLEAGLNHVAGLYDSRRLRAQLAFENISFMPPFSDTPHLYQELTLGTPVPVDPRRVDELYRLGHLQAAEAEAIRSQGAVLSHLENIERNDGFRGFNKPGIDHVLRKLDPRAQIGEDCSGDSREENARVRCGIAKNPGNLIPVSDG